MTDSPFSVVSGRPSLRDIANMPFPASRDAMRKYYDQDWGKYHEDNGEVAIKYRVVIDYETVIEETEIIEVEAISPEMAEKIARDQFHEDHSSNDEIQFVSVKEIES